MVPGNAPQGWEQLPLRGGAVAGRARLARQPIACSGCHEGAPDGPGESRAVSARRRGGCLAVRRKQLQPGSPRERGVRAGARESRCCLGVGDQPPASGPAHMIR